MDKMNSIRLLNGLLADHFTLMLKIWQFHWNVVGPSFGSYHEDLKDLYEKEIESVDSVAERIRSLDGIPLSSMKQMLSNNHIVESPTPAPITDTHNMWQIISNDWENIITYIRQIHSQIDNDDLGTLNFLEDMVDNMEKDLWMIKARIQ